MSASGTASFGFINTTGITGVDTFKSTGIRTGDGFIDGHITASGDISASGTGSFGRMLIGPQPINSSDDYMFSLSNGGSTSTNRRFLNLYRASTYFFQLGQYLNLNWRVNGSITHNIYNTSTGATNPLLKLGHNNSGIAHITTYNDDNPALDV